MAREGEGEGEGEGGGEGGGGGEGRGGGGGEGEGAEMIHFLCMSQVDLCDSPRNFPRNERLTFRMKEEKPSKRKGPGKQGE